MKKNVFLKLTLLFVAVCVICALFAGCDKNPSATATPESTFKSFTEYNLNYKDYVKIGEYKKITITKDISVTEEEIFAEYVKMMDEQEFDGVKTGTVKKGDAVSLAYCGYIDGKKFAGGESKHVALIIGSGTMIPGFEDACIGQKPGVEFDINVTFPENYGQTDLAGKPAVFKSKVNYIFPELSDATAKIATEGEYQTKDALYKFIKDGLKGTREEQWEKNLTRLVVGKVYDNSEIIKYPEGSLEVSMEGVENDYKNQGITDVAAYLGLTQEEYKKQLKAYAEYDMGTRLVRYRIAEIEKITVTDEEIEKYAEDNYAQYKFESAKQFIEYHTKEYVRETLLLEKVDTYLVKNVTIVDTSK
ncbi:MAG: hypothetical protein E7384_00945 [Ruminococcaceae bacterium]|nr:hypothetical protein [Oscillospiraceae bacterium]